MEKPIEVCKQCGEEFVGDTYRKRKYCSHKCYWRAKTKTSAGENNPNWSGGRHRDSFGYVTVLVSSNKRVREHRLVVEKHLGRDLKTEEIVHHINGDKTDNRLKNLQITTRQEHKKLHHENPTI